MFNFQRPSYVPEPDNSAIQGKTLAEIKAETARISAQTETWKKLRRELDDEIQRNTS